MWVDYIPIIKQISSMLTSAAIVMFMICIMIYMRDEL